MRVSFVIVSLGLALFHSLNLSAQTAETNLPVQTDASLKKQLDEVFATHQRLRAQRDSIEAATAPDSPQLKKLNQRIKESNARHLALVESILAQQGWPTKKQVGHFGSLAAFITIQQADITVQEKYLPVIRKATLQGDLSPMGYIYMQDHLLVLRGKPQMFGTKTRINPTTKKQEFAPIDDKAHVDERRAAFGLGPLADYAKRLGISYQ